MDAIARTDLKKPLRSDIVELKGARMRDFSDAFLKV
jgi:hypothetical protein